MPEGVRCTTATRRVRSDGGVVSWSCLAQNYIPRAYRRKPKEAAAARGEEGLDSVGEGVPEETADSSAEMRERLERAMDKAVKKTTAAIRENYEKSLRTAVKREVRKYAGSSGGAFPDDLARMKEWMEAAIERAVPRVRAAVQRDFGIEPDSTPVVKDDSQGEPVDESEAAPPSSKPKSGQ